MVKYASPQDNENIDLKHIFIGRENELETFELKLARWKNLIFDADPDADIVVATRPSLSNKLQGLVILLYGRGGFGKSTLLQRFYEIACAPEQLIRVGRIVDWEFEVEEKRGLFNPSLAQKVDAFEYYQLLCEQLAFALEKKPKDFRLYQAAVKAVEQARKRANGVLERLQDDDRYAALRGVTIDALVTVIGTVAPLPVGKILGNEKAKAVVNEGLKIGGELVSQVYAKLRDDLGNTFGDYLDAPLRLGLALGRDLHDVAKNVPLLLLFDTYEEIDPADHLLRVVMGTAGLRVGWVLAGRDNLWGGLEQRKRSIAKEYGYKDIVIANRGLAVDFNVGGVGAFTLADIRDYFDQVCMHTESPLPTVTEEEAEHILQTTQGVPLAVSIAAALYLNTADVKLITEGIDNQREIIDTMVERYLLHARDDLRERYKLYGLALLRRSDSPTAVAAALGLSEKETPGSYEQELSRLQRSYSFIFTEKEQPSLHQEVRHFLRLWLLEHWKEPGVVAINEQLSAVQEDMLKRLEERRQYTTLQQRLQDDEWVDVYLDLTEQQFWLDSVEGMRYLIPFMVAAAMYRRKSNEEAVKLGAFFASHFQQSLYSDWWAYASQCLVFSTSQNASEEVRVALNAMTLLAAQNCPPIPVFLPSCSLELEAALWYRLGEAHSGKDDTKALHWYEKALTRLDTNIQLREATSETTRNRAYTFYEEKKYRESISFLNRAIELKADNKRAYNLRGAAYSELKEYAKAIEDYEQAIVLDPKLAIAYNNRGSVYRYLKEYAKAIEDYEQAIVLDPKLALAWYNRGNTYSDLKEYAKAIEDYEQAIVLDPKLALAWYNRGNTYYILKEYAKAIEDYEQAIVLDPKLAIAYNNRGSVYRYLKEYAKAIEDYEQAIVLDPKLALAWYNRGNIYYILKEYAKAIEDYEQTIVLDPEYAVAYNNRGSVYHNLKEYQRAIEDYNQTIVLDPEYAVAWYNRGNTYRHLKEYAKAIEDYNQAIMLDPDAAAYNNRGLTYSDLKEYQQAIEDYNQTIVLDPKFAVAYYNRGNAYGDLKEYAKAIEDYNQAIVLDPDALAYSNRGLAYHTLKEYARAIEDYNQAIVLDPEYVIAYTNRGNAYSELKEYARAIEDYNQAIVLDPKFAMAYSNRGLAYHTLKEYARAIEDYNQVIVLDPKFAMAYNNRGNAYSELKEYSRAIEDYDQAIVLDPKFATAWHNRGLAYHTLKEYARAIEDYDRAIVLDSRFAVAYNNRGNTYYTLKEYTRAIEDYEKAIALDPKLASVYDSRGLAYHTLKEYTRAIEDYDRAIVLDPKLAEAFLNRGDAYRKLKRYDDLLVDLTQAFILDEMLNDTVWNTRLGLAFSYIGQYADAIERYEQDLKKDPQDHRSLYNKAVALARWKGIAIAQPDIERARAVLISSQSIEDNYALLYENGGIEAFLGNTEAALDYLQRAIDLDREAVVDWANDDVAWLDLRSHPRFLALVS